MATLKDIKNGVKVRNKKTGLIKEVISLPQGMTLKEALDTETLDTSKHVLLDMVTDNLSNYQLVEEVTESDILKSLIDMIRIVEVKRAAYGLTYEDEKKFHKAVAIYSKKHKA